MAQLTLAEAKNKVFIRQPIQWHLNRTSHDRCPRCGASLGYLGRARRACMSDAPDTSAAALALNQEAYFRQHGTCAPGTVWESRLTPEAFVQQMINDDEPHIPVRKHAISK